MSEPTDARVDTGAPESSSPATPHVDTIILPLDGSELAETAVPYAVELARLFNARLVLLRVLEEIRPVFDTTCRDRILLDEANPRAELQSPAFLAPVITRLEHEGIAP